MADALRLKIQVFDPKAEYSVVSRRLPHWSQAGTISFITWRTWDSIPKQVVAVWLAQRDAWLTKNGFGSGKQKLAREITNAASRKSS